MKWVERRQQQQQALKLPLPPPSPVSEFLPPIEPSSPGIESLSDLEKVAVLGHGNGGTVYKVRHRCTSDIFALKVIRSRQEENINAREARIFLKCSDSPFIVQCFGVIYGDSSVNGESGDICLVMEYMDGGSLLDLLRVHRRLAEEHIALVAKQVLQGLNYLHGMQIAHRDIKPSNLLINSRGEVKIADFGSSREVGEAIDACCYSYVGTSAYMSPERFNPDKCGYNGFAADVWALGLALLECHVGSFPLISKGQRPDWATLMCAICYGDLPHMPEASLQFQSFIRQCLEKDWRKRATVKELLNHSFVSDAVSK